MTDVNISQPDEMATPPSPSLIGRCRQILREHWSAWLTMNLIYFGLVVAGMALVVAIPSIQESLLAQARQAVEQGALAPVAKAYRSGNVPLAAVVTLLVNLIAGAFLMITVPSLLIPFLGLLVAAWRALIWGLLFSPANPQMRLAMLPHYLTLVLEGQGYVLAMLAVYLQSRWVLQPRGSRAAAFRVGLRQTQALYLPISIVLAIAALYEAIEVIHLVPRLK
jgi:hypothetical protein